VHAPDTHVAPIGHMCPHVPQLFGSLATTAQPPPGQRIAPVPHVQTPDVHMPPVPQFRPHAPQFDVSVASIAHVVAQATKPAPHWHAPAVHVDPVGHMCEHAPQFALSVCGFTHVEPQIIIGALHGGPATQTPAVHVCVALHAVMQLPQWL
jgi:hypothetical protein